MKKLILVVSFITGLSMMASARHHKSPERRAMHITKVLQKKLNLTANQTQLVHAVFLTQATRMDSLKSHRPADKKENHLAARSIMVGTETQVEAILNPSQKEQFMAWVKIRKQKRMEKHNAERIND